MALLTKVPNRRRNIKLVLEYDGTELAGWQRQARAPTVQGCLEEALGRLTGEAVTVIGAGRTDAGVHARGQAANFKTGSKRTIEEIIRGGNALLSRDIGIISAEIAPLAWHARYQARSKVYDYDLYVRPVRPVIDRRRVWSVPGPLDTAAMGRSLGCLLGRHDFAAFQSTGSSVKTTVRTMLATELSTPSEDIVRITLEADGFLRHMVRAIVGTLVLVGRKRLTPEDFKKILLAGDRGRAGPTAPAQGLCLREVKY